MKDRHLFLILLYFVNNGYAARWTETQANEWYEQQPWFIGTNFIPSTAINSLEMWQSETFDIETISRELSWAASLNMNLMRVYLHHLLWQQNADDFASRIDKFLQISSQNNIQIIFVLFDECHTPNPKLGLQPIPIPGVHNSGWVRDPGQEMLLDQTKWSVLQQYTADIITRFQNDTRIALWDLYNEPECSQQVPIVLPLLKLVYAAAISANPVQPLTVAPASSLSEELAQYEISISDVITFHNYAPLADTMRMVEQLKTFNRPLICTEYLARTAGSTIFTHIPYFYSNNIGSINWGLVSGK
ncbi:unnamed protein product, partial [Didymodactylos carnosus]